MWLSYNISSYYHCISFVLVAETRILIAFEDGPVIDFTVEEELKS